MTEPPRCPSKSLFDGKGKKIPAQHVCSFICRLQTIREMSDSEDDDVPRLSSHALAALQEFYSEQKQQSDPGGDDKYNIGIIEENWVSAFHVSQEMWVSCLPILHLSIRSGVCLRPASHPRLPHLPLRS